MLTKEKQSKTQLAKKLGVSRASLYYKSVKDSLDELMKQQILIVLAINPSYGHKRIALEFNLNKKRIKRIMKKYLIKPYRRRAKRLRKQDDEGKKAVDNVINIYHLLCPIKPNIVWASDFTYIKYQGRFIYLATIIDVYTRELIGWNISTRHDTELVLGTLKHAIERTGTTPMYLHSDQGSEYCSKAYYDYAEANNIILSMSHKSSPWENGFQESFYSQFKVDLGFVSRFETVEELIEEIYQAIYYYNNGRIHTSLKMAPVIFKQKYKNRLEEMRITV